MTFRGLVVALAVLAGAACAGNAWAANSPRVFLVRTNSSTASAKEAMNRMQGELAAEGFDVSFVDSAAGEVPSLPAGEDTNSVSIELVVDADEQAAELRVIDHLTNKTVIRRTKIEAQEASQVAQVLSVRAVELLRASLMELLIRSRPRSAVEASPPVDVSAARKASTWAAGELQIQRESTWGFDAGGAGLVGFGGSIPPALLAVIRVRLLLGRAFQLRATAAGLGPTTKVNAPSVAPQGSGATVSQNFGLFELVTTPWSDAAVAPVISLGGGPFNAAANGINPRGFTAITTSRWTAALDAGVGLRLRLSDSFDVDLEAQALLTLEQIVTRFAVPDGTRVEGEGISQPSLFGSLTIVGWL